MSQSPVTPSRWLARASRRLLETRIFEVSSVNFYHPVRGTERDFFVINTSDWVNVVAVTPDDLLVMVRQFRYGIGDFSWELPGGVIDRGEDPVLAGMRELCEETGYTGASSRRLGTVHPNPAILDNTCHLVLAEDVRLTAPVHWDADEEIETALMPVEQVLQWARDGRITHSLVLNALFYFEPVWRARKGRPI